MIENENYWKAMEFLYDRSDEEIERNCKQQEKIDKQQILDNKEELKNSIIIGSIFIIILMFLFA